MEEDEFFARLPQGNCCLLVITNRIHFKSTSALITIGRLSTEDAIGLLTKYRPDAENHEEQPYAHEIVEMFNGLPIGLALIGCLMTLNSHIPWASCRDRLRKYGLVPIEKHRRGKLFGNKSGPPSVPDYVKCVDRLFDDVFESLSPLQQVALEYAALFPQAQIVTRWLSEILDSDATKSVLRVLNSDLSSNEALSNLVELQLLSSRGNKYETLSLNPILRRQLLRRQAEGRFQIDSVFAQLIQLASRRVANCQVKPKTLRTQFELTPLLLLCNELRSQGVMMESAEIVDKLILVMHHHRRFDQVAWLLLQYVDDDAFDDLPPERQAVMLSSLAASLTADGNVEHAQRFMERAIQLGQEHLPPDHPTLAAHYSNFAGILERLGNHSKAKRFVEQAIAIEVKRLGKDHRNLGIRYWWLGDIEGALGHRQRAFDQYSLAKQILTKHLSPDHRQIVALNKIIARLQDPPD